jgi:hypothetical protein
MLVLQLPASPRRQATNVAAEAGVVGEAATTGMLITAPVVPFPTAMQHRRQPQQEQLLRKIRHTATAITRMATTITAATVTTTATAIMMLLRPRLARARVGAGVEAGAGAATVIIILPPKQLASTPTVAELVLASQTATTRLPTPATSHASLYRCVC